MLLSPPWCAFPDASAPMLLLLLLLLPPVEVVKVSCLPP
jgi:hypothetical protein